jgi:2-aminoethylphosphonate-pyruvate transaminase
MLHDWGSRDGSFIELTARLRRRLTALAEAEAEHVCVPIAGSGTFAIEAMLGTLVPRDSRVLVLANGAYGRRIANILIHAGRRCEVLTGSENQPLDSAAAAARLDADNSINDVVMVHCETTSGVLNPLDEIAEIVSQRGKRLLVDAMSSFGAIPIDANQIAFDGLAASANKCLESVPGAAFVRRKAASAGASRDIGKIATRWSRACARWASKPICPTIFRRPSSLLFAFLWTPPLNSRLFTMPWRAMAS